MRSIGKRNVDKLKRIVEEEMTSGYTQGLSQSEIEGRILDRIPAEWFDIWESAHDEIHRVMDDAATEFVHRR